jgi:flagellar protein FliO/FliZ
MFDLLGVDMPPFVKFFIAFATVLVLIGLTAWLVRRFGASRLGGANARGRQPRLAVIDAATVDGRRRLVLIRRDNVEHLLMIGGPTDLVVEPNILRAAQRDGVRETGRAEPALRSQSTDSAFPLQPVSEPPSIAPAPVYSAPVSPPPASTPRTYRANVTEEPWLAPEPGARPRPADSLTGLAAELSSRLHPPSVMPAARNEARQEPRQEPRQEQRQEPRQEPRQEMRSEPPLRVSAPPPSSPEPAAPQTDHNLAEMAHQLEAALRRAPMPESRPPVTDPLALPTGKAPDRPRAEPKFDMSRKPEAQSNMPSRQEPKLDMKPDTGAAAGKNVYDSLEEEMASLLGRPPGKT